MPRIQLHGRFLLAQQMVDLFEHEGIEARVFEDVRELLQHGDPSVPVILWTTELRHSVVAGVRLWRAGFSVHRYWMGGDVLRVRATAGWRRRLLHTVLRRCYASHAISSAWLGEELAAVGIPSTPLPLNPACCAEHWPVNDAPEGPLTVLFYSWPTQDAIYRPDLLLAAAAALPEVRFLAVGNAELRDCPPNVEVHGMLDTAAFRALYPRAHLLLRPTTHDGFPRMVLEAMSAGLEVLFVHPIPHTTTVGGSTDIIQALRTIASRPRSRNMAARQWAFAHHSAATWVEHWRTIPGGIDHR